MNDRNDYGYPVMPDLEAEVDAEAHQDTEQEVIEDEHEEMFNHV